LAGSLFGEKKLFHGICRLKIPRTFASAMDQKGFECPEYFRYQNNVVGKIG
jgi:hypothetical protein